jgi:ABC-type branched-subunit amino acid transport system permease subunit
MFGQMYELYVIAAVVVGGTSLSGGRGTMLGTLIGAFIIAVIQNGMNLTGVESYQQKVVLGLVILGAVLLTVLPEVLRYGVGPLQQALFGKVLVDPESLRMLIFGLALVLVMRLKPAGLWPSPERRRELAEQDS